MVLSTEWSQVEVIDLINDGNGLGFILVGGRSTGVVIKALQPGGVAERDQRLQLGDHLLQIGEVNLRGFSSEQVATVLRQTGAQVRLIVARPIEPTAIDYHTLASNAPIIPTKLLSDPEELSRHLFQNPSLATATAAATACSPMQVGTLVGLITGAPAGATTIDALIAPAPTPDTELADLPLPPLPASTSESRTGSHHCLHDLDIVPFSILSPPPRQSLQLPLEQRWSEITAAGATPTPQADECDGDGDYCSLASGSPLSCDSPETQTYVVELHKNVYGLGITVAGYVCEEEDVSGIFVKSIIEGSAAEMSGQIQINDRIVAVDGRTLAGVTNHQAVELLRNTDIVVQLTLERFLRGRKFEHLQVALTELKGGRHNDADAQSQLSMPASPSIATLSWLPPKSQADADSIVTDAGDAQMLEYAAELPSRDTVDSNMSHMLDRSDTSAARLTNGNGLGLEHDSGNDTDEQEPKAMELEAHGKTPTNEPLPLAAAAATAAAAAAAAPKATTPTILAAAGTGTVSPSAASLRVAWKSLGISLEGTVDVECGIEKRPHHYIRSILEDGPVGRQGILRPGDELLQVNEHKLQGLRHIDVVRILKELPPRVKLVCARGTRAPAGIINTSQNAEAFESRSLLPGGHQSLQNLLSKAQSESSLYTSSTATLTDTAGAGAAAQRSKSLENVSGLALWSCEVTLVGIEKTEQGFGFSILDYQDPLDAEGSVIVIRGLIRGGAAEATNEIYPGDRLISVGEHTLQGLELGEAVSILKSMPPGKTKLGICRPLSNSDSNSNSNIASPINDSAASST
ncbi:patj homolog isoform X2 [Drosophila busckii]|uniref:patj homolog isoform X2 n=1 Tax=Drosophila busckii TaxID=30019 RepID=UPI00083EBB30|nr:patj homolog isoform X2 [Drosophila busckii]